ncbi:MAG: hypothetical protein JO034_23410 [Singulisphaera sp.]|nr:hypothetical protein [Singulisphaera sp.]
MTLGEPSATPQGPGRVNRFIEKLPYGSLLQGSFLATLLKGRGRLIPRPRGANGLWLEAEEVMRCLSRGEIESAIIPMAETVAVMETIDQIRGAWSR